MSTLGRREAEAAAYGSNHSFLFSGSECQKVNNGHIVPRMYRHAWEGGGRQVAVHKDARAAYQIKSTKVVGARGPYYRRTRPRHGTQTDDIEASLAYVEDKAAPLPGR